MSRQVIRLDVREDIRNGREPFSRIMETISGLKPSQDLLLIAPFEPVPLYGVLAGQGFAHAARSLAEDHWEIHFTREPAVGRSASKASPAKRSGHAACAGTPVVRVEARGLEPPEPLVRILEAAATLPRGAEIEARTDRRPVHLYPRLEERGLTAESVEQKDGSFVTRIRHH